jgi:hypothetical protein
VSVIVKGLLKEGVEGNFGQKNGQCQEISTSGIYFFLIYIFNDETVFSIFENILVIVDFPAIVSHCRTFLISLQYVPFCIIIPDLVSRILDVVLVRRIFSSGKPQGDGILE